MSKKRILTAEKYKEAEAFLIDTAAKMDDPLNTPEERERHSKLFQLATKLMDDYMMAVECRDPDTCRLYLEQGLTTQEWLDKYWTAMANERSD